MGLREDIEGGAMATYLTGSMNTLHNKLTKLENRPEMIGDLKQQLVILEELFFEVAARGKRPDQAHEWMKHVRELFFQIEDWIDEKLGTPKQKKDRQLSINMADPSESEEDETNMVDSSESEDEGFRTNMAGPSEIEENIRETNKVDSSESEDEGFWTNMAGPSEIGEKIRETNMEDSSESEDEGFRTNMAGPSEIGENIRETYNVDSSESEDEGFWTNMAGPSEIEEKIRETYKVDSSESEDEGFWTNMAGPSEIGENIRETYKVDSSESEDEGFRTNMAGPSEIQENIRETYKVDPSEMEEKIKGFITLIEEACCRCTRYKLVDEATTSGATFPGSGTTVCTTDSQLLLEVKPYFVALDGPLEQLKKYLTDDQTELKVVSIVGTGGLGKTTLATKIHEEIQGKFQCAAFVHVGCRHQSTSAILVNLLQQLTYKHESERLLDEQQVIAELWTLLSEKRYLVVLDCIWSIRTWRVISCALPDNDLGSRILITTRMKDVAKSCSPRYTDVVHQMEALSIADSKLLFEQKAKREVDDDVLTMCGGIPLAITLAAGLSTVKDTKLEEPKTIGQGILSSLGQYYSLSTEMTEILHMSYADLSVPVRSCFLYLSVFPEDYTIKKDHLIRLWFAEGFIPKIADESFWVAGERCFNELISRRLIQPVYDYEDDKAVGGALQEVMARRLIKPLFGYEDGQAVACTVQPVILDFIRTLSTEENFATTAAELSSTGPSLCGTIRRFSLDCSNEDEAEIFESSIENLSCIRSLTVLGDVEEMPWAETAPPTASGVLPGVMEGTYFLFPFKLLRILDMGDAKNLRDGHLKGIGELILLRYLRLAPCIVQLPKEIGKLEKLETLDLRRTPSVHFPGSIINLRKLVQILFRVTASPDLSINHLLGMRELEEVSNIDVDSFGYSPGYLRRLLSDSKRLKILGITLKGRRHLHLMYFLQELWKSKFDSLSLYCREFNDDSIARLLGSWVKATASAAANFEPRRLELNIYPTGDKFLGKFPPHMDSLGSLTHLHIPTERVEQEDVGIHGNMQRLVLLNWSSDKPSVVGRCLVKEGAFPSLLVLSLSWRQGGMGLRFQQGAMPQLRRLFLGFTVGKYWDSFGNFDFGMENITCLTRIHATINCHSATVREIEAAESQAREEVPKHINKPILELCRSNFDFHNRAVWGSPRRTRIQIAM